MKLYRVILPVTNIDEATAFYSNVFNVPGKRVSPGRHYFDCGGTVLACFDPIRDGDDFEARPNPDHIYLSVKDLNLAYNRVKDANPSYIEENIQTRPWGETSFYAKDPFGNPLCFVDEKTVFTG